MSMKVPDVAAVADFSIEFLIEERDMTTSVVDENCCDCFQQTLAWKKQMMTKALERRQTTRSPSLTVLFLPR
jgi:hypothetical protein